MERRSMQAAKRQDIIINEYLSSKTLVGGSRDLCPQVNTPHMKLNVAQLNSAMKSLPPIRASSSVDSSTNAAGPKSSMKS